MVKLTILPDPDAIRRAKGHVDYYQWKGIHVARSWPRPPIAPRSPAVQQQIAWLSIANQVYSCHQLSWRKMLTLTVKPISYTPRDQFMRHFFGTAPTPAWWDKHYNDGTTPYPIPQSQVHYWALLASRTWKHDSNHYDLAFRTSRSVRLQLVLLDGRPALRTIVEWARGRHLTKGFPASQGQASQFYTRLDPAPSTIHNFHFYMHNPIDRGPFWAFCQAWDPWPTHPAPAISPWFFFHPEAALAEVPLDGYNGPQVQLLTLTGLTPYVDWLWSQGNILLPNQPPPH